MSENAFDRSQRASDGETDKNVLLEGGPPVERWAA